MMRALASAFLFASCLAALAQISPNAGVPLAQSLIANTNAVLEAQKSKNVDLLKRALTDDFLAVGSEAQLHDKEEIIESAREGVLQGYSTYNPRMVPVNEDAAIVTYDCIIRMPEGDPPGMAPRYQRISDLWVRQNGEWRLRFEQATAARPID